MLSQFFVNSLSKGLRAQFGRRDPNNRHLFCLFKKTEKQTPVKTWANRGYGSKQTIFHFDQWKQIKIAIFLIKYKI